MGMLDVTNEFAWPLCGTVTCTAGGVRDIPCSPAVWWNKVCVAGLGYSSSKIREGFLRISARTGFVSGVPCSCFFLDLLSYAEGAGGVPACAGRRRRVVRCEPRRGLMARIGFQAPLLGRVFRLEPTVAARYGCLPTLGDVRDFS